MKQELVSLLGKDKLAQSLVSDKDTHFISSDDYSASVLFDDDYYEEWLSSFNELEEKENIREFYIVTQNNLLFKEIKSKIEDLFGTYTEIVRSYIPMSEGFKENAIFFDLKYEDGKAIRLNMAFKEIAPLLWMKAGSKGRIIQDISPKGYDVSEQYAILFDYMAVNQFIKEIKDSGIKVVYIVTDSESLYQQVYRQLPRGIEPVRLYENYLTSFGIYGSV